MFVLPVIAVFEIGVSLLLPYFDFLPVMGEYAINSPVSQDTRDEALHYKEWNLVPLILLPSIIR